MDPRLDDSGIAVLTSVGVPASYCLMYDDGYRHDTSTGKFLSPNFKSWKDHHSASFLKEFHQRFPSVKRMIQNGELPEITTDSISLMKRQMLHDRLEVKEFYLKDFVVACMIDVEHFTAIAAHYGKQDPDLTDLCLEAYMDIPRVEPKSGYSPLQLGASAYETSFVMHHFALLADLGDIALSYTPAMTVEEACKRFDVNIHQPVLCFHRVVERMVYHITHVDAKPESNQWVSSNTQGRLQSDF